MAAGKPAAARRYRPAGATKTKGAAAAARTHLGVTIWRLRPAAEGADGARLLVQEGADSAAWQAERVDAESPLAVGDRVRLSFEAGRAGYLYVIDREQYADGSVSDPHLIFPTTRTRRGDNRVEGGRLVDVPDQGDRPNYFSVRRSRPDQVSEVLTVIVSPTPIPSLAPAGGAQVVPAADLARWEREWAAPAEQFALEGGQSTPWTEPEQRAGADPARLLTQDDPPPQTVFRMPSVAGRPVIVNVRLPYGAGQPKP